MAGVRLKQAPQFRSRSQRFLRGDDRTNTRVNRFDDILRRAGASGDADVFFSVKPGSIELLWTLQMMRFDATIGDQIF